MRFKTIKFQGTHLGQNPGYLSNLAIQHSIASLVAFVLNAIEFHAHRGTIWSAELQLRRLPDGRPPIERWAPWPHGPNGIGESRVVAWDSKNSLSLTYHNPP